MSRIALLVIVLMAPLVLAGGSVEMPGEEVTQIATTTVIDAPKEKSSSPLSLPISYSSAKNSRKVPTSSFQPGTGPFIYAGFIEQRRIAKASEDSVDIVWWQNWINSAAILISMVGIGLLGWTLLETRRATETGHRAAKAAEDVVKQNRAYMVAGDYQSSLVIKNKKGGIGAVTLSVSWENTGLSPAINVRVFSKRRIIPIGQDLKKFDHHQDIRKEPSVIVGRDKLWGTRINFPPDEVKNCHDEEHRIIVYSVIEYSDVYGRRYISECTSKILFMFDLDNVTIHDDKPSQLPTLRMAIGDQQDERLIND